MSQPAPTRKHSDGSKSSTSSQSDHDRSDRIETKQLDFIQIREWLANSLGKYKAESQVLDRCVDYLKQEEHVNYATFQDKLTEAGDEHDIAEELWGYLRKMARREPQETLKESEAPNHIDYLSDADAPTPKPSDRSLHAERRHDKEGTPDMERDPNSDRRDPDHTRRTARRPHPDYDRYSKRRSDSQHLRSPDHDRHVERGREPERGWDADFYSQGFKQVRSGENHRNYDNCRDRERASSEHLRDSDRSRGHKYRDFEHRHESEYRNSERRLDSERYQDAEQHLDFDHARYSERASRKDEKDTRVGRNSYDREQSKANGRGEHERKVVKDVQVLRDTATSHDKPKLGREGEDAKGAAEATDFVDDREKKVSVRKSGDMAHGLERQYSGKDSFEPSDDGKYSSRRHRRRSRSRSDREDSRERRHRRRRRRREDDDEDDREYRRRRRRHRRRSLSRSRSPRRTLSEERERERRREERRARRRERELVREEDRERRRTRKRRLDPEKSEDRDVIKREKEVESLRGDRSRAEFYDEHEYRRQRRKRRRHLEEPWDNEFLSDADLSDGRYHDRGRRHRHRHKRDHYDDDGRRLRGAFRQRHEDYLGEHYNEHPINGELRRQLPAAHVCDNKPERRKDQLHDNSQIHDDRGESCAPQRDDDRDTHNDLRKMHKDDENRDEPRQASVPHHAERAGEKGRGQLGTQRAEFELEPAAKNDALVKSHQVAKRAHVTSRLGKIEARGAKSSDMVDNLSHAEGAEPPSGSTPWDGRGTKSSEQDRLPLKERMKSKVSSTILDRLRSKALASMSKRSSSKVVEETIQNPRA